MDIKDIYWVAALLDGEGCFSITGGNPRIFLKMTDRDTVERASSIMKINTTIKEQDRNGWKTSYIIAINSHTAIGWMMILYCHPYMSARRKEQIKQVLSIWRNANSHNGVTAKTGEALIHAIARKYMIPHHEARKRLYSGRFVTDSGGKTNIGFRS